VIMEFKLDDRFTRKLKGTIEQYSFDVGILENKPRKAALGAYKWGLTIFAGDLARKKSRTLYGDNTEISKKMRERYNYLLAPFKNPKNKDILNFVNEFFRVITGKSQAKRLTNLLQAIIRNPILRQDYGHNSSKAIKRKTFDRLMIDTGQFFQAIKARVMKKGANV
jgi:hypothetical protein